MTTFYITDYFGTFDDPYSELSTAERTRNSREQSLDFEHLNMPEVWDPQFTGVGQYDHVRRPMRGIQLKDETYASIWVEDKDGNKKWIINESYQMTDVNDPFYSMTSNFLLQSVNESRAEKQQVVETFGPTYIFFFGERPRVLNCAGILLNTADFAWRSEWWENYERYFRGTQLVREGSTFHMEYDDVHVVGYILSSNATTMTEQPYHIVLNFQIFLTDYVDRHRWSTEFPKQTSVVNPIDIPDPPPDLQQTTAGKVRQLALADYLSSQAQFSAGKFASAVSNPGAVWQGAGLQPYAYLKKIEGFLYGRPEVIPKGYAGSEAVAGFQQLTFAGGTALDPYTLDVIFGGDASLIRQAESFKRSFNYLNQRKGIYYEMAQEAAQRTKFRMNFDEFPAGGYVYSNGMIYALEDAVKEGQRVIEESAAAGRELLVAEDEARFFEEVARQEFISKGVDPDSWLSSTWARMGAAAVGTAIAASGAFLLSPDSVVGRAAADSDSADQWGVPGSARTRYEGHVPNDTPRWWEDPEAQGSAERRPFSTAT